MQPGPKENQPLYIRQILDILDATNSPSPKYSPHQQARDIVDRLDQKSWLDPRYRREFLKKAKGSLTSDNILNASFYVLSFSFTLAGIFVKLLIDYLLIIPIFFKSRPKIKLSTRKDLSLHQLP